MQRVIVRTATGATVELGVEIARGGEAVIHRVVGDDRLLAKVFFTDRTAMADKLTAMRDHPPPDPAGVQGHSAIAWPRELLLDDAKRLIGFLMPYIRDAVPALDVLNPRRRAQTLPDFDRAYLHRAARNLASALAALHAAKVVVGDLNERNVLVTPRALVTLIDADSFQIQRIRPAEIVFYPCPVGRAEYTPPELQGQPFHDTVRLPEHDAFGLAVLLFQLLMAGSHPFRSAWLADGEAPPLEEKIRRGWFPYLERPAAPVAPPPGTPALGALHPVVVDGFVRAFAHGHADPHRRPTAEDWAHRLEEAEAHLIRCPTGHAFADHLAVCPDCGARRRGAPWSARRSPPPSRVAGATAAATVPRAVAQRPSLASTASPRAGSPPASRRALAGLRTIGRSFARALMPPPMPSTGTPPTALRRARIGARHVAATTAQAVIAASGAVAIGLVVTGITSLGALSSGADADPALRQSVAGWLAGGLAMAAVVFARSAVERRTAPATPSASTLRLGRAVGEPIVGWTVGWIVATSLVVVPGWVRHAGPGAGLAAAASGATGVSVSEIGWAVGWATFGAVAGALAVEGGPPVPARAAALFAAIGYGVARGVLWLVAAMP